MGSITLQPEVHATCQKRTLHYTRACEIKTSSIKICPGKEFCTGYDFAKSTRQAQIPAFGIANNLTGNSFCMETCGGFGCRCWGFGEACLYFRNYGKPVDPRIFEIFTCDVWHINVVINATITHQQGSTTRLLTLQEGQSIEFNKMKIGLLETNEDETINAEKEMTFISSEKTIALLNEIGKSAANTFKCSSKIDAENFKNCSMEIDSCRCLPADGTVSCSCLENRVLLKQLTEHSLPYLKGKKWIQSGADETPVIKLNAKLKIILMNHGKQCCRLFD